MRGDAPRKGVLDHAKREAMARLFKGGADLAAVAAHSANASEGSVYVLARRWGLHVLRRESFSAPTRRKFSPQTDEERK